MREPRRWPEWVFDCGEEPDPRFTLANERTFLAHIRTVLALLAASVVIDALQLHLPHLVQRVVAGLLALIAVGCAVEALRGWARTERALRLGQPLPTSRSIVVLAATATVLALLLALGVVLR